MERDDLFTHIHKALRRGLFEVTMLAGATDWADDDDIEQLAARWQPLLALLRSHTEHEDRHILRVLDPYEHQTTDAIAEQHTDLEELEQHLAESFDALVVKPDPVAGLAFYRDLARFTAAYLPHLQEEETVVMPRIWARCTDEEIAAARAAFMAETTPEIQTISLELMLPSLDRPTRTGLVRRMAATAPPEVVKGVLAIGDRVLGAADSAALHALVSTAPASGDLHA
ncbi:hemerythrin domain-containing protein [Streptosporangium sp. NPDC005286]|uniref:hemerythrin domain-containing protein n=1 Tax=Streptosporangium sp. NPDC005286 TaxID=3154463 RepID=UPI0033BDFEC7